MNKGKILILSGPSGVGKGTVVQYLVNNNPNIVLSVSATTREPREGEIDGVHYFFISKEDFAKKIENDEMLEFNEYNENYYGTIKSHVNDLLKQGKHVLLEIDVNGAYQVKNKCPEAITVFLIAPSEAEIERRLRKRNTEDEETIKARLQIAVDEMKHADSYDHIVCNDSIENASEKILNILNHKK